MELKDFTIDQLSEFVNKELLQGESLVGIAKKIAVNESSIRKKLNKAGYKRIDNQFKIVDNEQYEESKRIVRNVQAKPPIANKKDIQENRDIIIPKDIKENIIGLASNYDRIMKMLKQYEGEYDKKYEDEYDGEYDNSITIELPIETKKDYRATTRVNNVIWEQFGTFCDDNKTYTKRDLVSMALKQYMDKYR